MSRLDGDMIDWVEARVDDLDEDVIVVKLTNGEKITVAASRGTVEDLQAQINRL